MRTFLVIFFITFSSLTIAQEANLKLVADYWPPFTNEPNQIAFAQSLVYEALSRADVQATTTILPFDDVLASLRSGDAMGSPALWFSSDRAQHLLYSEPYLENQVILVGAKGADVSARSLGDLRGKRIAVVQGYAYGNMDESGVILIEGADQQACLIRVLNGEADYMLVDALLVNYVMQRQAEQMVDNLAVGENVLLHKPLHFAVRKDMEGAESLIAAFNAQIEEMQNDGTYNRILELNSIQKDVDGDGRLDYVLSSDASGSAPMMASDAYRLYHDQQAETRGSFYVDGQRYATLDEVTAAHGHNPEALRVEQEVRGDKTGVYLWNFDL